MAKKKEPSFFDRIKSGVGGAIGGLSGFLGGGKSKTPSFSTVTSGALQGKNAKGELIIGPAPIYGPKRPPAKKKTAAPTGGGTYDPTQDILASSLAKINAIYNSIPSFKAASFDEAAARASVGKLQDEFYNSKLNDFMKGVNLQREQSQENERRTLTQLTAGSDRYQKSEKQQYDIAKEQALSGVVGAGRQLSGFGGRALGRQQAVRANKLTDYLAGIGEQEQNITADQRQYLNRLKLGKELTVGEDPFNKLGGQFGREKSLAIEQGVTTRAGEFVGAEERRYQQYQRNLQSKVKKAALGEAAKNPSIAGFLGGYY